MIRELIEDLLQMERNELKNLYHLSNRFLGNKVVLVPRVPHYAGEDSITPRVSLSNSLEGCLKGSGGQLHPKDDIFYFYEVINQPKLHKPTTAQVYDVGRTGETWALTPVELKLKHKIKFTQEVSHEDTDYSKYEIIGENE